MGGKVTMVMWYVVGGRKIREEMMTVDATGTDSVELQVDVQVVVVLYCTLHGTPYDTEVLQLQFPDNRQPCSQLNQKA